MVDPRLRTSMSVHVVTHHYSHSQLMTNTMDIRTPSTTQSDRSHPCPRLLLVMSRISSCAPQSTQNAGDLRLQIDRDVVLSVMTMMMLLLSAKRDCTRNGLCTNASATLMYVHTGSREQRGRVGWSVALNSHAGNTPL